MNEYASMDDYLHAKLALFTPEHACYGVVSLYSSAGNDVQRRAQIPVTTITSPRGSTLNG